MTALIGLKQRLKNIYGSGEAYLKPLFKFALGLLYFVWINQNMGYMSEFNNLFIVLILALVCSILPTGVMVFAGFVLMVGHAYAICLEAGVFMLIIILFISIFFMRFSSGQGLILVGTPLAFGFDIPAFLPIAGGLLGNVFGAFQAASGVILFYAIRILRNVSEQLTTGDLQIIDKARLMTDSFIQNFAMWLTVLAFVITYLLVNLLRTRSFDHAWKVAVISGSVTYALVMILGGSFLNVGISLVPLAIQVVASILLGLVLEFFCFGGDFSHTEHLEYEDDEYYYYVKAVPKASVPASDRKNKKPVPSIQEETEDVTTEVKRYSGRNSRRNPQQMAAEQGRTPVQNSYAASQNEISDIDFEKKLEESLREL